MKPTTIWGIVVLLTGAYLAVSAFTWHVLGTVNLPSDGTREAGAIVWPIGLSVWIVAKHPLWLIPMFGGPGGLLLGYGKLKHWVASISASTVCAELDDATREVEEICS